MQQKLADMLNFCLILLLLLQIHVVSKRPPPGGDPLLGSPGVTYYLYHFMAYPGQSNSAFKGKLITICPWLCNYTSLSLKGRIRNWPEINIQLQLSDGFNNLCEGDVNISKLRRKMNEYDTISNPSGHKRNVKYQTWVSLHQIWRCGTYWIVASKIYNIKLPYFVYTMMNGFIIVFWCATNCQIGTPINVWKISLVSMCNVDEVMSKMPLTFSMINNSGVLCNYFVWVAFPLLSIS